MHVLARLERNFFSAEPYQSHRIQNSQPREIQYFEQWNGKKYESTFIRKVCRKLEGGVAPGQIYEFIFYRFFLVRLYSVNWFYTPSTQHIHIHRSEPKFSSFFFYLTFRTISPFLIKFACALPNVWLLCTTIVRLSDFGKRYTRPIQTCTLYLRLIHRAAFMQNRKIEFRKPPSGGGAGAAAEVQVRCSERNGYMYMYIKIVRCSVLANA